MILLKKLPRLHKKVPGISLMIAFLTSMLVLALALVTLASIVRSFERTVGIERGNKVFFAAESGIEAAFFHKNSRQSSVHFDWESWSDGASGTCGEDEESGTCPTELKTVEIQQTGTGAKTRWKLLSRFVPPKGATVSAADRTFSGMIGEFQNIEIPMYYQNANKPTDNQDQINIPLDGGLYNLFVRGDIDTNGTGLGEFDGNQADGAIFNFGDNRTIDRTIPTPTTTLAPGARREQIVVDWSVSRTNGHTGRIQTFSPIRNIGVPCQIDDTTRSAIWCEDDIVSTSAEIISFNDANIHGNVRPCNINDLGYVPTGLGDCKTSLPNFMSGGDIGGTSNISNIRIQMQQLAPLEHQSVVTGNIIAKKDGINFEVELPTNVELPLPYYTIVSEVEQGNYQKEITLTVNEATSIGAFNYVIFE